MFTLLSLKISHLHSSTYLKLGVWRPKIRRLYSRISPKAGSFSDVTSGHALFHTFYVLVPALNMKEAVQVPVYMHIYGDS